MDNKEPRSRARLAASVVLLVVIGASLVAAAYLRTTPTPTSTSTSTTSSQGATSSSTRSQGSVSASCITVVPYDTMQKMRSKDVADAFSVLYNGDDYTQTFPNGTQKANLGWTLLIEASQSGGPSENVTFGWDPTGPSIGSGERLPGL